MIPVIILAVAALVGVAAADVNHQGTPAEQPWVKFEMRPLPNPPEKSHHRVVIRTPAPVLEIVTPTPAPPPEPVVVTPTPAPEPPYVASVEQPVPQPEVEHSRWYLWASEILFALACIVGWLANRTRSEKLKSKSRRRR